MEVGSGALSAAVGSRAGSHRAGQHERTWEPGAAGGDHGQQWDVWVTGGDMHAGPARYDDGAGTRRAGQQRLEERARRGGQRGVHWSNRPDGLHLDVISPEASASAFRAMLRCMPPNTNPWNGQTAHQ